MKYKSWLNLTIITLLLFSANLPLSNANGSDHLDDTMLPPGKNTIYEEVQHNRMHVQFLSTEISRIQSGQLPTVSIGEINRRVNILDARLKFFENYNTQMASKGREAFTDPKCLTIQEVTYKYGSELSYLQANIIGGKSMSARKFSQIEEQNLEKINAIQNEIFEYNRHFNCQLEIRDAAEMPVAPEELRDEEEEMAATKAAEEQFKITIPVIDPGELEVPIMASTQKPQTTATPKNPEPIIEKTQIEIPKENVSYLIAELKAPETEVQETEALEEKVSETSPDTQISEKEEVEKPEITVATMEETVVPANIEQVISEDIAVAKEIITPAQTNTEKAKVPEIEPEKEVSILPDTRREQEAIQVVTKNNVVTPKETAPSKKLEIVAIKAEAVPVPVKIEDVVVDEVVVAEELAVTKKEVSAVQIERPVIKQMPKPLLEAPAIAEAKTVQSTLNEQEVKKDEKKTETLKILAAPAIPMEEVSQVAVVEKKSSENQITQEFLTYAGEVGKMKQDLNKAKTVKYPDAKTRQQTLSPIKAQLKALDGELVNKKEDAPVQAFIHMVRYEISKTQKEIADFESTSFNTVAKAPKSSASGKDYSKVVMGFEKWHFFYDPGQTILRSNQVIQLEEVAMLMNANPETNLNIIGYADKTGSENTNNELSKTRAEVVRNYLLDKGVDSNRLEIVFHGETKALKNNDPYGRRVEVKFAMNQ